MLKFFLLFLLFNSFLLAQISPGDLTSAHSDLEGLSNCTKCHELGEKVLNSKCLDCHSEISGLINVGTGYHSSGDVKGKDCSKCHPEHFGRNFRIVNFDQDSFDHNKAKYDLTGAHKKSDCKKCHQSKNISDPKIKDREGTYLGLNSNCFSCHEDYHQETLGDNCNACHHTESFKPAVKFNHENAKFKLTGLHIKIKCIKCHSITNKDGKDFQKFTGLQFLNCSPCHNDTHQGKFGRNCNNCHVTTSFTVINKKGFDHSKTNYPLLGKHTIVNCDKCHKAGLKEKPEYGKCTNCHSDYHKGQFVKENIPRDCKECHNEYGFYPANYTIEKHKFSKFVLTGAHLATPCEKCHLDNKDWEFRNLGLKCINCHKNIHSDEIVEKYLNNNTCNECHVTESWNTINFNHDRTEFKLLGKHKSETCSNCHHKEIGSDGKKLIFKSLNKNCEVCHNDIHGGQFKDVEYSDCTRCHTFDDWKPEKFDHEKTKFSLKGAHEKINCIRCHPYVSSGNINFIKYKLEEFKCSACHS
jgi:nitrate/TMAO reductase-like tetraheme cytochrome c subunit